MGDAMVACSACKQIENFLHNLEDDAFNVPSATHSDLVGWIKANAKRATKLLAMEHE